MSWPRLTEQLAGRATELHQCWKCLATAKGIGLARWQEHDERDQPEPRIIILCAKCASEIIAPHPRLYREMTHNEPWPGAMAVCVKCRWRQIASCTNPAARTNGGRGVKLTLASPPMHAMVDGPRYRGPMTIYTGPVVACEQRQE